MVKRIRFRKLLCDNKCSTPQTRSMYDFRMNNFNLIKKIIFDKEKKNL